MDRPESISIDYSKWFMSTDSKSLCETKYLVEIQKDTIKDLQRSLDVVTEQRDNAEDLLDKYRRGENEPFLEEQLSLGQGIISEEDRRSLLEINRSKEDNYE